jgi:hypothetical protein
VGTGTSGGHQRTLVGGDEDHARFWFVSREHDQELKASASVGCTALEVEPDLEPLVGAWRPGLGKKKTGRLWMKAPGDRR